MNVGDIASDIAQVFGVPTFVDCPLLIRDRILIDFNAAIQQLQNSGEDYYGREDLSVPLVANTESYTLEKDVQSVLDPVRLDDGTLLRKLTSRGQLFQYGQLFRDQLDDIVPPGKPTAFYIETVRDLLNVDDSTAIIHLVPNPSAATVVVIKNVIVPVIREPAIFGMTDLVAGTAMLPVPQKYVESIFLPLARWNATTSFFFYEKEKIPRYQQDYDRALQELDAADPRRLKTRDPRPSPLQLNQPSAQAPISPVQQR